ncbi:MAG: hypothetical protein ACFFCW_38000 [Candidatus Hodarchaeota archaeon]
MPGFFIEWRNDTIVKNSGPADIKGKVRRGIQFGIIDKYTQEIRDLINEPRKQHILLKNEPAWSQLCSALDVIGDSTLAIESYSTRSIESEPGQMYLLVYGLMQALVLQQDAVRDMCEALGFKEDIRSYPLLFEIRRIRHDTAGHPTKTLATKNRFEAYHHISRITLRQDGFQLLSSYRNGSFETRDISIPKLLNDQKKYVTRILRKIVRLLKTEITAHKKKFQKEKLVECFPHVWSYHASKLAEGTYKQGKWNAMWAFESLRSLENMLEVFREALARRGIDLDTYDSVKWLYDELEYSLSELRNFFEAVKEKKESSLNHRAAYIFTYYIRARIGELRKIAEEIDENYVN